MKGQQLTLLLLSMCWSMAVRGQLYYFSNADSTLIGVRNAQGDTIIAPAFPLYGFHPVDSITEATIEFNVLPFGMDYDFSKPAIPMGAVYDRMGKFLYYPQFFDNGPDYWQEGLRRYAENGKIGFADRLGNKVTPPGWEFAEPFNYGYAKVYDGKLKKVTLAGGEHWTIAPKEDRDTLRFHLIDRNGQLVHPLPSQQSAKDYLFESKYYPYPFSYSAEEQSIVDSVNRIQALSLIHGLPYVPYKANRKLQFELTEHPNLYFPYYVLAGFDNQRLIDNFSVLVHQHTKAIYIIGWQYSDKPKPLHKWILNELEQGLQIKRLDSSVIKRIREEITKYKGS